MADQNNDNPNMTESQDREMEQRQQTSQGEQSGDFTDQDPNRNPGADRSDQTTGQRQDPSGGFVGSNDQDSGDYLQARDPQQAGFAEQGRGAPDQERSENRSSDIEGGSNNG